MVENNGHMLEEARETPVEPWKHLVRRRHPWRKQLYVKGRNMTARQLVGAMKANNRSEDETAYDFGLSVEVAREALAYVEQNKELVDAEVEMERTMHKQGGAWLAPLANTFPPAFCVFLA